MSSRVRVSGNPVNESMMKSESHTTQGNLGEAVAIYCLTLLGYRLSKPLQVNIPYDLVADDGQRLYRVSVKTTRHKQAYKRYRVQISTKGGNTKTNNAKSLDPLSYDLMFILVGDGTCYLIPCTAINCKHCLDLTPTYDSYVVHKSEIVLE